MAECLKPGQKSGTWAGKYYTPIVVFCMITAATAIGGCVQAGMFQNFSLLGGSLLFFFTALQFLCIAGFTTADGAGAIAFENIWKKRAFLLVTTVATGSLTFTAWQAGFTGSCVNCLATLFFSIFALILVTIYSTKHTNVLSWMSLCCAGAAIGILVTGIGVSVTDSSSLYTGAAITGSFFLGILVLFCIKGDGLCCIEKNGDAAWGGDGLLCFPYFFRASAEAPAMD